jgi:hypothetical protein
VETWKALDLMGGFRPDAVRMQTDAPGGQTFTLTGMSNREFLERYAQAGRIGLSGGITFVDNAICRAERHLDEAQHWGTWSHAFLFQGRRADGHHWVIESDLQIHRKHIQLGVQENRAAKYYDEQLYSNLAVLDFGLTEAQGSRVVSEALDFVADHTRYSLRELFGTLFALHHPGLRDRSNILARESSLYCSALVRHLFVRVGLDLSPGVDEKNTTPEDIARTAAPHTTWVLQRSTPQSRLGQLRKRIRRTVGARIRKLKQDRRRSREN